MNILALIPARMGSSRFPGKPMARINGTPMIELVHECVLTSQKITHAAVATCDLVIKSHIESIGGVAIMTSDTHERASDRCAEALLELERIHSIRFDIVVMVQGDEPLITGQMIDDAVNGIIARPELDVVNLMGRIVRREEFESPNCIKVAVDLRNRALFFSRKAIPSNGIDNETLGYKQICVIPFQRKFLTQYSELNPTPLEVSESVDMLRVLEHGYSVGMVFTDGEVHAVDMAEDIPIVETMLRKRQQLAK